MVRGLYTSALGMTSQMKRMDVLSNNIANVNTTGYKKDVSVTSSFDDMLAKRTHDLQDKKYRPMTLPVGDITYGVFVEEVHTDFSQGNIKTTHGSYDLAIGGSGFFTVRGGGLTNDQNATRYTRDGSFTVSEDGYLVTTDGGRVQGAEGDIRLTDGTGTPVAGNISIEQNGDVFVGGELMGTLRMADFEDLSTLRKQGDNYLATTAASQEIPFTGSIIQGALEASNVNTVKEMVDLITVNRIYEANQKVIHAIDQTLQRSASDVGRKA